MADDWSFLDNIDFGGGFDLGQGGDWGGGTSYLGDSGWGSLTSDQLNSIYGIVSGSNPDYTVDEPGWLSNLMGGGGSDVLKLGLSALLGTIGKNAATVGGSTGSSSTDPQIAALMAKLGLTPIELLSGIMNELGGVSKSGAMASGTPELLRNAALAQLIDPATGQINSSILNYIMNGGQLTSQETEARNVYESAMGPQLLQKTQDLIRQMGGGAWSSGPQAQLMQDAIARAQLESATGYSTFLNTQGTTLANRQRDVAGLTPELSKAYTTPLELTQPSVAAMNIPLEQQRLTEKSLREQAQNAINTILGKASPTYTTQTTPANQPYWASILTRGAQELGTTSLQSLLNALP